MQVGLGPCHGLEVLCHQTRRKESLILCTGRYANQCKCLVKARSSRIPADSYGSILWMHHKMKRRRTSVPLAIQYRYVVMCVLVLVPRFQKVMYVVDHYPHSVQPLILRSHRLCATRSFRKKHSHLSLPREPSLNRRQWHPRQIQAVEEVLSHSAYL